MIQFTLRKKPTTKEEHQPSHRSQHGSKIVIPKITEYKELKKVISNPKTTLALGNPLDKFEDGDKLVYQAHRFNGKEGYFTRVKDNFKDTLDIAVLDIEISDTLGDKCDEYRLTSKKKVIAFMTKFYPHIKNYTITKSYSQIEGKNNFKWHIYILFDKEYTTEHISKYVQSKLPEHSFVYGLSSNGNKLKKNAYLDLSVFGETNRLIYEHVDVQQHLHHVGNNKPNKVSDFTKTVKAFTEPSYRDVFPQKTIEKRKKKHIRNYARKNNISKSAAKRIIKTFEDGGSLTYSTSLMLSDGSYKTVGEIVREKKQIRLYPPLDMGDRHYKGAMGYYPEAEVFKDYHNDIIYDAVKIVKEVHTFRGEYKKIIPFEHRSTLEIAPTGSGKTHQFEKQGDTIILVPKNSMVDQHKGIKAGEDWEVFKKRPTLMTYDKFEGHMLCDAPPDLSDITVVVDEVHTLTKRFIFNKLIKNKEHLNSKKLILMSATPHVEFYEKYVDCIITHKKRGKKQIIKYVNTKSGSHDPVYISQLEGKVLVYKQNKRYNEKVAKWLRSEGKKVLVINKDTKIPDRLFDDHDIVITTSTLREGFNIKEHVDHVVVLGGRTVSVEDTVQFIARVRGHTPDIHILMNGKYEEEEIKPLEYSKYRYVAIKLGKQINSNKKRTHIGAFEAYEDIRKSAIVTKSGEFDEVGLQLYYKRQFDKRAKQSFKFRKKAFRQWGNYKVIQVEGGGGGIGFGRKDHYLQDLVDEYYEDYDGLIEEVNLMLDTNWIPHNDPEKKITLQKILEVHNDLQWFERPTLYRVRNAIQYLNPSNRNRTKMLDRLKQFKLNKHINYNDNKPLKIGSVYTEGSLKRLIRGYIRKEGKKNRVDLEYALKVAEKKYNIRAVVEQNGEVKYQILSPLTVGIEKIPFF